MIVILMSMAGGLGASARFISDGLIGTVLGRHFPWATMIINGVGSFILGIIAGLILKHHGLQDLKLVIGTGFCGGFTTFSTACFESVRLVEERRFRAFWLQLGGGLLLAIAAVALGLGFVNILK